MTMPTASQRLHANLPFPTHDLNLAAFLRCKGYSLTDVQREPSGRCAFVFADQPTRERDVASFYADGTVSALRFAEALRMFKARIHAR